MFRKLYFSALFLFAFSSFLAAQNIRLQGKITDAQTNEALPGAVVHLDETNFSTFTNVTGNYVLTGLKAGDYKIKVNYIGYVAYEKEITVTKDMVLDISLKLSSKALQAVSVYGKLDNESESASRSNEKNSDNIKNVIGAQAIAKSPDINAANVLQRVSGVTIQRNAGGDDAYPIVRGIEPRYNNTLINGVKIASPDNKSRFVSLSVVPSDLLQRIEVSKSLLPEMEGDAVGGTVNLVFKDAPDQREITATGFLGYNQIFIDRKFADYSRKDIAKYSPGEINGLNYNATADQFSRSNLDFKQVNPPPTSSITFTYGQRFLNNKLGFIIGNTYQDLYYGSNSEVNYAFRGANTPDNAPFVSDILSRQFSTNQKLNNLITHFDYRINDKNKISIDNVLLYSSLHEATLATDTGTGSNNGGRTIPGTGPLHFTQKSTNANQLIENIKIVGNHILTKHFLFDWVGAYSDASNRMPDQATLSATGTITYDPKTQVFTSVPVVFDGIDHLWQNNDDKDVSGAANLTYTKNFGDSFLQLKAGGLYRHKTRLNFEDDYSLYPLLASSNQKEALVNINVLPYTIFNPNGSNGKNSNNYDALENVTAYYGEFKLSLPRLDVFGGVRSETTSQGYTLSDTNPYTATHVGKDYTDILPSIQLKFKLDEKTNVRASYYSAIARPSYFDLVPIPQPTSGPIIIQGNPDLIHTTSHNYDIRYELYPQADEQIYVGAYYKKLINPIEVRILGTGSSAGQQVQEPVNTNDATVAGLELAFTKYVGNFGLTGNYAFNHSDVFDAKLDRNNPNASTPVYEHRKLTGAAVHDLNVSFLYRDLKRKINAQLAYQFLGSTLVQIYQYTGDNYIQSPQSVLAFSGDAALTKHFVLFTKLNNLLNTHTVTVLHDINTANEFTKATYLLGLRYNY